MKFEFKDKRVIIDMVEYVEEMLKEFPKKFHKNAVAASPARVDLFQSDKGKKLDEREREIFHRTVAKALFLCKRA